MTKTMSVIVDDDFHRRFKTQCGLHGCFMNDVMKEVSSKWLKDMENMNDEGNVTDELLNNIVGVALEDIPKGGYGRVYLSIQEPKVGDHISFVITGPDAYNEYTGVVYRDDELDELFVDVDNEAFNVELDDDLLNVRVVSR